MKTKTIVAVSLLLLAALSLGTITYFHLGGLPGSGGPEKWTGPGSGGPESVAPARYWTGPGQGGPESTQPVRWICGMFSGGSVE